MNEKAFRIERDMVVIGHDGRPVGEVDSVEGDRIRLKKASPSDHAGDHQRYIGMKLVSAVEGDQVRLFANAEVAVYVEEEESGRSVKL